MVAFSCAQVEVLANRKKQKLKKEIVNLYFIFI
jgi:hypothetical protein